mgnify:CR=1 FL=1
MVGKASLGVIQLIGGHTKVKEYPVRTADAKIIGYLLYLGIPSFLNINKEEGLSFSSSTLAIGVLVLEVLLAITVILWGYGYRLF